MAKETIAQLKCLLATKAERLETCRNKCTELEAALATAKRQKERLSGTVDKRDELLRLLKSQIKTFLKSHYDAELEPERDWRGDLVEVETNDAIRWLRCLHALCQSEEVPF